MDPGTGMKISLAALSVLAAGSVLGWWLVLVCRGTPWRSPRVIASALAVVGCATAFALPALQPWWLPLVGVATGASTHLALLFHLRKQLTIP